MNNPENNDRRSSNLFGNVSVASVSTVIIPVGGFGTRMLPITQAVPKALLPIGTKPLVMHAVDEALEAGATRVIIAARPDESDLFERQFRVSPVMKDKILKTGRRNLLEHLERCEKLYSNSVEIVSTYNNQGPAASIRDLAAELGLGQKFYGVILPDDLYIADEPVIGQLIRSHERSGLTTLGVRDICLRTEKPSNSTFVGGTHSFDRNMIIERMQVKPKTEEPVSSQVSNGRYILNHEFSNFVDKSFCQDLNEVSMSAVIKAMVDEKVKVGAYHASGQYYDCGDFMRYQTAVASFLSSEVKSQFNRQNMDYMVPDEVSLHPADESLRPEEAWSPDDGPEPLMA